jgi:hypothetical protein
MDTLGLARRRLCRIVVCLLVAALTTSINLVPTIFKGPLSLNRAEAASIPVCSPSWLEVMVVFNGPGNPYGAITFVRTAGKPCSLSGRPVIRVVTKSGKYLHLHESTERLAPALPRPTGPAVLTAKAPWAVVEMDWCGFTSTYNHLTIRFAGWSRALSEKNPPYSKTSFVPPPCSNTSKSLLGVDYVRDMDGGTIAGSTQRVRVTPSTDLHSGEKVHVYVTGLGLDAKFWISECASRADANGDGCGEQLAAQPFGETNMDGAGSYTFVVRSAASDKPYYSGAFQKCFKQCVLVAAGGDTFFADAPITFAGH